LESRPASRRGRSKEARVRPVPALLLALASVLALAGEETAPPPIPGSLAEVLETEFPGLALAETLHFDPSLRESLDPPPARLAELGRGRGDLDGDGREDWALLLTGAAEHLVAILLDRGEEAWQVHLLLRRKGPLPAGGDLWLRVLPGDALALPLSEEDPGGEKAKGPRLLHELVEMGSGGSVWITYWDRGRPITRPRPAPGE
jgi:hypothetical protein